MDRRFMKTEKAIRDAYFNLLQKGRKKITVAEIARIADIDRKTFYLHYQSVDDIVVAFAKDTIRQFLGVLKERGFYPESHDLIIFFQSLNEFMIKDYALYRILSRDHNYDFFWDAIQNIVRKTIIDLVMIPGELNDSELHTYADLYTCGIIAIYRRWLEIEGSMSLDELGNYLSKISETAFHIYKKDNAD